MERVNSYFQKTILLNYSLSAASDAMGDAVARLLAWPAALALPSEQVNSHFGNDLCISAHGAIKLQ
jgi:hypothetical protein